MTLVARLTPEFERWKLRYPPGFESSLVLPCLHRIQEERGYVADEDVAALTAYLAVPRKRIEEVLSYYTQYRRTPPGRWRLQVCRNLSCSMRGAESLLDHLRRRLAIEPGQTTADGRFTLETVECLASCGTAPVLMVNERYHENMNPARVDALLEQLR